ncbi:MAG: helix-turn-helix transcriptional regulator [Geminicoccaceae bacterium]
MSLEHSPARETGTTKPAKRPPDGFLTIRQVADWIGVTPKTIWAMVRDGRLEAPIYINSRNVRFKPGALERFEQGCRVPEYAGANADQGARM